MNTYHKGQISRGLGAAIAGRRRAPCPPTAAHVRAPTLATHKNNTNKHQQPPSVNRGFLAGVCGPRHPTLHQPQSPPPCILHPFLSPPFLLAFFFDPTVCTCRRPFFVSLCLGRGASTKSAHTSFVAWACRVPRNKASLDADGGLSFFLSARERPPPPPQGCFFIVHARLGGGCGCRAKSKRSWCFCYRVCVLAYHAHTHTHA